jgi:uncharacterized protein YuzE
MSVTVAGIEFAHHHYDPRGDVLYLSTVRQSSPPPSSDATEEGHCVEYDERGRVIGLILVNVRWLLERDGELTISWPPTGVSHLAPAELDTALVA